MKVTENANNVCKDMAKHINRVAKEIFRKSKENKQSEKEIW